MRTDVGRTGARQCAFATGRWKGRAGQRGAFGGKRERDRKRGREREFRDECFMALYHAARNIPFKSQSGIFKAKQIVFIYFHVRAVSAWLHAAGYLRLFIEHPRHEQNKNTPGREKKIRRFYITDGL